MAVDAKGSGKQAAINQPGDMASLLTLPSPPHEVLGVDQIDVVASRGYFKIEDIEACEKTGCVSHVDAEPDKHAVVALWNSQGPFQYDTGLDAYSPAGKFKAAPNARPSLSQASFA